MWELLDWLRSKFHKHKWHQVTMTYERYPDGFLVGSGKAKLYYDGKLQDEASISDAGDYSLGVWFNTKTHKPYISIKKEDENLK